MILTYFFILCLGVNHGLYRGAQLVSYKPKFYVGTFLIVSTSGRVKFNNTDLNVIYLRSSTFDNERTRRNHVELEKCMFIPYYRYSHCYWRSSVEVCGICSRIS